MFVKQLKATTFAQNNGVNCVIASGMVQPQLGLHRTLLDTVDGLDVGTFFPSRTTATETQSKDEV